MKYAIFGIVLALNLGARAQAASPIAVDPGTTGGAAQATSPPVAVDPHAGMGVGEAQPASSGAVAPHAGATGGEVQAPSPIAVEIHGGTTGGGGQVEYVFNDYFAGRVSGDWLGISHDFSTSDVAFSGRANWATAGAFVDLHPLKNGWFVSGGVFQGDRNGSFSGVATHDVIIDGVTFTPDQLGTLMGEAKLPSTSPFVGLGWDQAQHPRSGLTFRILAGAAFGGAKVSMRDVGPYSDTAPVQMWLAQQVADAQNKANAWKAYPVVQLGIGYRF